MTIKIREAKKDELPTIRQQRIDAYQDHMQSISEEHWLALKKSVTSDADQQPSVELLVAEVDGKILGSVAQFPARIDAYGGQVDELDYPEIRLLAVDQAARRKGVASALIDECIRRAKSKGYHFIGLHTGEFMTSAIALYERYGFERLPQHDFMPANDGVVVKAFRLSI